MNDESGSSRRRSLRLSPELDDEVQLFMAKLAASGVQIYLSELIAIALRDVMRREDAVEVVLRHVKGAK